MSKFLDEKFGLNGKTAVITGGGGALCGEIARGFIMAGANVILWGRRVETLELKVREITAGCSDSVEIRTIKVDLTVEKQVEEALDKSIKELGKVDILVNGVGGSSVRRPLVEVDEEEFEQVMKLNLMGGCILPTKYFARYWIDNHIKGVVINISSMGAYLPLSGGWAYSAAKAAVMNQTVAHARELAPYGIRVNAIAPGFFLGKQNKKLLTNEDGSLTPRGQSVIDHTPMGKFGSPEDLVAATLFLAGDGAQFVTGVSVPIDGGFLCHGI